MQPIRSSNSEAVSLAGFPVWQNGKCSYRAFELASSRVQNHGSDGSAASSSMLGSVKVEVFPMTFVSAAPKYSTASAPTQAKASVRGDKKFFETPSVSAAPGRLLAEVSKPASMAIGWQGAISSRKVVFYDTALNLELRGVVNRREHAHLLPPDPNDEEVDREARARKRRIQPLSDTVDVITIDLLDEENEKITIEKRPRAVLDIQ